MAAQHEHRERGGHDGAGDVHRDEEVVAVAPVGEDAAPRAEHEDRQELGGGDEPDGHAAVGDGEHQQADGDHLHPRAGLADDLADEEQPEVAAAQRAEGVGAEGPEAGHRAASPGGEVLEHVGGGDEPLDLVGAEVLELAGQPRRLAGSGALDERLALGGELDAHEAAVGGVGDLVDQALLVEEAR